MPGVVPARLGMGLHVPPSGVPFPLNTWVDITPAGFEYGTEYTQGMTLGLTPGVLYVCIVDQNGVETPNGVYKSVNFGASWIRPTTTITFPVRARVSPTNPSRVYVADGVNGATTGFYRSTDGGLTYALPSSFLAFTAANGLINDSYHVECDPTNGDHVLLTFHNGWADPSYNGDSGILETFDGGDTWTIHAPPRTAGGFAGGYNVFFLYNPALGIGNANTWLFTTQGDGLWRTTNAGASWTQVSTNPMDHGGGSIYYMSSGRLFFTGGNPYCVYSDDNGATWTTFQPDAFSGYLSIIGDGTHLYCCKHGGGNMRVALESAPTSWSDLGGDPASFAANGNFELAYDKVSKVLYAAQLGAGVFARRLG